MSKNEKLIERLLTVPSDFTWEELIKILTICGFIEVGAGKTAGSRRKFVDGEKNVISLHKPHPANMVKKYAIKQVIDNLKEKGKI